MATTNPAPDTCLTRVYPPGRWHWGTQLFCGRPIKGQLADGTSVCGVHLRVERQKVEKDTAHDRRVARCKAVEARLHVGVSGYHFDHGYSDGGPVKIHLAALEGLAARLAKLEADNARMKAQLAAQGFLLDVADTMLEADAGVEP